ncbi:hypothetical protein A946_03860 [Methylacidiphilum kamchatkense Kam1]|uniref:Uncharacterized protein n=1 Tax=Methylacidiphilum kamchatkense Kam1 TaxID=1202785 RepID=A0ABR4ZYP2_9BACT|nr:hypothetical protein A946_03860 [Methylacidiphilum kamchatkense Kam1]
MREQKFFLLASYRSSLLLATYICVETHPSGSFLIIEVGQKLLEGFSKSHNLLRIKSEPRTLGKWKRIGNRKLDAPVLFRAGEGKKRFQQFWLCRNQKT